MPLSLRTRRRGRRTRLERAAEPLIDEEESPPPLVRLQQTAGNAAVCRLLADGAEPGPPRPSAPPSASRPPGRPLDADVRARAETALGQDLGRVRVHDDARAARLARARGARAYALGADVVFDAGAYAPRTREGERLLAHELAHVVQQDLGAREGAGGTSPERTEREARTVADEAAGGLEAARAVRERARPARIQADAEPAVDAEWLRLARLAKVTDEAPGPPLLARAMGTTLRRTNGALEQVEDLTTDPAVRARLARAGDAVERIEDDLDDLVSQVDAGRLAPLADELERMLTALDELERVRGRRRDARLTARTFDQLVVAAGRLAGRLPTGAWTAGLRELEGLRGLLAAVASAVPEGAPAAGEEPQPPPAGE
jgi:hypothetical protein